MAHLLNGPTQNVFRLLNTGGFTQDELLSAVKAEGVNVDALKEGGSSFGFLHFAALFDNTEFAAHVLKLGGELNLRNGLLETPLIVAACYSRENIMRFLLDHGADLTAVDKFGDTAQSRLERPSASMMNVMMKIDKKNTKRCLAIVTQTKEIRSLTYDGNKAFVAGKLDEAIALYTKSLEPRKTSEPYALRAASYLRQEKYELAKSDCEAALELDPNNVKAYCRLVKAYQGLNDHDGARKICNKGLAAVPRKWNEPLKELLNNIDTFLRAVENLGVD